MADPYWEPIINAAQARGLEQENKFKMERHPLEMKALQLGIEKSLSDANERTADEAALATAARNIQEAAKSGKKLDPVDALEMGANDLALAGRLNMASKLMDKVELARTRQARQEVIAQNEAKLAHQNQMMELELLGGVLDGVQDQVTLDRAVKIYETQTKKPVPEEYRTYSPQMIDALRNATLTGKMRLQKQIEDAKIAQRQAEEDGREKDRRIRAEAIRTRNQIAQRQTEIKAEREARLGKEGGGEKGKGSVVPPAAVVKHADAVVKQLYPDLPKEQRDQLARDAAADAMIEIRRNPAADSKSAVYSAAQRNAKGVEPGGIFSKSKYKGAGSTEANPLPMPDSIDKLIPNRFYRDSNGVVKQFKGN